jgi:aspartate aminotransferase
MKEVIVNSTTEINRAKAPEVQAKSGKYANMVYSDFCRAAASTLKVEPIDMGYGDPANNKYVPKRLLETLVSELGKLNAAAYPDVQGDTGLLEAFREYMKRDEDVKSHYHMAIVSSGGRSAITNLVKLCMSPNDIILIPYPAWSGYKASAGYNDAKIFPINTSIQNNFVPTEENVRAAIADAMKAYPSSSVRMMILNSPHNPTGTVYSKADIKNVLKVLSENNIICLADYTYRAIRDRSIEVASVLKVAEEMEAEMGVAAGTITHKVVAMQTLGKVSLTPGLRIGYIASTNEDLIGKFLFKKQATDFAGSQFIQRAFADYLHTADQVKEFDETVSFFNARRSCFLEAIAQYGYSVENKNIIVGSSGFYVSFQVPRRYQVSLPLTEFSQILKKYPFIEESINAEEYRGYFELKGNIPASELFVLEMIDKTGINILPGRLFCSTQQGNEEYETWVRVALIQDEKTIEESFARIKRANLLAW